VKSHVNSSQRWNQRVLEQSVFRAPKCFALPKYFANHATMMQYSETLQTKRRFPLFVKRRTKTTVSGCLFLKEKPSIELWALLCPRFQGQIDLWRLRDKAIDSLRNRNGRRENSPALPQDEKTGRDCGIQVEIQGGH
jgi:hypothetical protein